MFAGSYADTAMEEFYALDTRSSVRYEDAGGCMASTFPPFNLEGSVEYEGIDVALTQT